NSRRFGAAHSVAAVVRVSGAEHRVTRRSAAHRAIVGLQRACAPNPTYQRSIRPRLRRDVLDLVRHRKRVHRSVVDAHGALGIVGPGQGVLHPIGIVPLWIVLARMTAATLLALL